MAGISGKRTLDELRAGCVSASSSRSDEPMALYQARLAGAKFCPYCKSMDKETAGQIIDLQAEITALRGAVRMLLHNAYNADESALAILRERAFQADRFQGEYNEPNERSTRYRAGVREAVASLLDPFQPDNDEASRLANPASIQTRTDKE